MEDKEDNQSYRRMTLLAFTISCMTIVARKKATFEELIRRQLYNG